MAEEAKKHTVREEKCNLLKTKENLPVCNMSSSTAVPDDLCWPSAYIHCSYKQEGCLKGCSGNTNTAK